MERSPYGRMRTCSTIRAADGAQQGAHLERSVDPGTEDDPSFMQTLATARITGCRSSKFSKPTFSRQDLQKLGGDDALNMFARMAGMQEDLSALRAATKGSAAQGSIRPWSCARSTTSKARRTFATNSRHAQHSIGSHERLPGDHPAYLEWFKKATDGRGASPSRVRPIAPGQHTYAIDDKASVTRYSILMRLYAQLEWAD